MTNDLIYIINSYFIIQTYKKYIFKPLDKMKKKKTKNKHHFPTKVYPNFEFLFLFLFSVVKSWIINLIHQMFIVMKTNKKKYFQLWLAKLPWFIEWLYFFLLGMCCDAWPSSQRKTIYYLTECLIRWMSRYQKGLKIDYRIWALVRLNKVWCDSALPKNILSSGEQLLSCFRPSSFLHLTNF